MDDYHIHTTLCKHAGGEASAYVTEGRNRGLREICFTDHAPAPDGYDPDNRMSIGEFPEYLKQVAEAGNSAVPKVLLGIEADYYPSGLGFLREWLSGQNFDLVLGSVHYLGEWGFDDPKNVKLWDSVDVRGAWREYFRLVGELADTRLFDVVAHLDLPKKFGHRPKDGDIKEMAQPILDRLAKAHMGIEISTAGLRKPVKEIYPSPMLLALACEREIPICFGSDAHLPQEVGFAFDQALALAREVGYERTLQFRRRERVLVPL